MYRLKSLWPARSEKAVPLVLSAASVNVTAVPLVFGHLHRRDKFQPGRLLPTLQKDDQTSTIAAHLIS